MSIPVENLYYLLCYAWDRLDEGGLVDVSGLAEARVCDLMARVLASGTTLLLQRGLDRGYRTRRETLATVRGRIDFTVTARRLLTIQARVHCAHDELQHNVLHNRILKTTLRRLALVQGLNKDLRQRLLGLHRRLTDVQDLPGLSHRDFARLQLHRNNAFYIFLMKICELVLDSLLVDQRSGRHRFRDFLRDERRMALLFQHFVFNFYRREQSRYRPSVDRFHWDAKPAAPGAASDLKHLPLMETDISLRSDDHTLIIDTKYHQETLTVGYHGSTPKVKSENLYQLYAYLANLESCEGPDATADGMLLYPDVGGEVRLDYQIKGHNVQIRTINLAQPWEKIHDDLLGFVPSGDQTMRGARQPNQQPGRREEEGAGGGAVSSDGPTALEVFIGGYGGMSYRVTWEKGAVEYRTYEVGFNEVSVERVRPGGADWNTFWNDLEKAGIWGWAESYHPDPGEQICDGTSWELRVVYRAREARCGGSNAFPERFDGLLRAVSRLVGGREFR